jgi:hypothetical protein
MITGMAFFTVTNPVPHCFYFWRIEMSETVKQLSTIKCPECGYAKEEHMLTDSCRILYQCQGCGVLIHPKPGDCCVFCSYGNEKCPSMQDPSILIQR